jgi:small-conductance mechanosensitive channel
VNSTALFLSTILVFTFALAAAAEVNEPLPIPLPLVSTESQKLSQFLAGTAGLGDADSRIDTISEGIEERTKEIQSAATALADILARKPTLEQLSDLGRTWQQWSKETSDWAKLLESRAAALDEHRQALLSKKKIWEVTGEAAEKDSAPDATRSAISSAIKDIQNSQKPFSARLSRLATLQQSTALLQNVVAESRTAIESVEMERRASLLSSDESPLWSLGGEDSRTGLHPPLNVIRRGLSSEVDAIRNYWSADDTPRAELLLLLITSLLGAVAAKSRANAWEQDDPRRESSVLLLSRPYSIAIVAALGAGALVTGPVPRSVEHGMGLLILPPTLRVLSACVPKNVLKTLPTLAVFYILDRIRGLLTDFQTVERLILFVEVGAALLLLLWLLRPKRVAAVDLQQTGPPWILWWATRSALVLLVTSLGANVIGYVGLSRLLGNGVLTSTYVGVGFYGLFEALTAAFTFVVQSTPISISRAMALHGDVVQKHSRRVLGSAAVLAWLFTTLGLFAVRESALSAVSRISDAGLSIGDFKITLGDVAAFSIAVLVATFASRIVRFLLQVEVFPRISLGRGLPNAISSMVHYGILLAGLYVALAAAGVDLSKLTILVGALGVGIGFGLQNVVNNFISGLILLFERPVQVGDTIDVGNMLGQVKRIGIRSSTLRTFTGSEVIVPNSDLISNRVTNWTLSDPIRRVDIQIGVAYGTEPERVLTILRDIADAHEKVERSPAPDALFRGFGNSSLDFEIRVWLHFEDWYRVHSEINIAISRALADNQIEIPFPQRDLHLRSVDESISATLLTVQSRPGDSND